MFFFFSSHGAKKEHHEKKDGAHHDDHHESVPDPEYDNIVVPHTSALHQKLAILVGATFWLWVFWRAKHE